MTSDRLERKINDQIKIIQEKLEATDKDIENFRQILSLPKGKS